MKTSELWLLFADRPNDWVFVDTAAMLAGITERAMNYRIERGQVTAKKVKDVWVIDKLTIV